MSLWVYRKEDGRHRLYIVGLHVTELLVLLMFVLAMIIYSVRDLISG